MFIPIINLITNMIISNTVKAPGWLNELGGPNMTKIYMHADLNFKLVRIIYTLRERKNVCKHVPDN
jgi:hypothetical protein